MIGVRLSLAEILLAATVGLHRHVAAIGRGLPDRNGHEGVGWNLHIEGACGEMAVAKALNLFWAPGINTFKNGGDVARFQVRTRSQLDYELIIRPDDVSEHPYVLVVGMAPEFQIIGWIYAKQAKLHDEWKQTHGGRPAAWFVPQADLNGIEQLPLC